MLLLLVLLALILPLPYTNERDSGPWRDALIDLTHW
jgi:hypothetical protein